jgi:dTDP-glucose 4,6-dehydratase
MLGEDAASIVTQTAATWDAMRGARIFLTGGTGFVGTWLLETLAQATAMRGLDVELVVLTRDVDAFRRKAPRLAASESIHFVVGDVRNFAFPAGDFSHVVHAATAASATLNATRPAEMLETILDGTRRVLELARRAGAQRMLLVSSGAVYGRQPSSLSHMPESYDGGPDPLDPTQAYAEGKRVSELWSAIAARAPGGPHVTVARCFAFVGPHLPLDIHFAIGNFVRDALAGGPIHLSGDGAPYRSYLYAADLAGWLWSILARGANGRAYNVGSTRAVQLWDVAQIVASQCGGCDVTRARAPEPNTPAPRYVPDVTRAREELGLEEWTALETAVRRTLEWHRLRGTTDDARIPSSLFKP